MSYRHLWNDSTISNRQHVLESAGETIDDAAAMAQLAWSALPVNVRAAINDHGFDDLCEYGL